MSLATGFVWCVIAISYFDATVWSVHVWSVSRSIMQAIQTSATMTSQCAGGNHISISQYCSATQKDIKQQKLQSMRQNDCKGPNYTKKMMIIISLHFIVSTSVEQIPTSNSPTPSKAPLTPPFSKSFTTGPCHKLHQGRGGDCPEEHQNNRSCINVARYILAWWTSHQPACWTWFRYFWCIQWRQP